MEQRGFAQFYQKLLAAEIAYDRNETGSAS